MVKVIFSVSDGTTFAVECTEAQMEELRKQLTAAGVPEMVEVPNQMAALN